MKLVVGGGISGLIWAFYNDEYSIISDQIGGQLSDAWLGPRLLHDKPENRQLLSDLDLPIDERTCTIGYLVDGEVLDECPDELREMYYRKSRCLAEDAEVPSSVMSSGENVIHHLGVDWETVIEKLTPASNRLISGKVDVIVENRVNEDHLYEHLVWTPPLPFLFQALDLEAPVLRSLNKLFVRVSAFDDFDLGDFDYVYVPGPEYTYHRVTKVESTFVVEWTGVTSPDCLPHSVLGTRLLKRAQLIPLDVDPHELGVPQNIKLLGRMAQWDHSIKIEDIVSETVAALD